MTEEAHNGLGLGSSPVLVDLVPLVVIENQLCAVALRIQVDNQHFVALAGFVGSVVARERCFANSALVVEERN